MKKIITVCLSVLISIALAMPASASEINNFAVDSIMSPDFTYIWSISAGLGISSTGKAQYSGSVDASSNSYTAELTVSLQKSTSSGWTTIKSWSDSGAGQSGLIVEGYYYIVHGTYRVRSTAKIYSSSGKLLETESFYSAERTY